MSDVAIIRCESYDQDEVNDAVKRGVELLGGAGAFVKKGEKVYNPFSLLNTLYNKQMRRYWFETGTPTFLVKALVDMHYDLRSLFDNSGLVPLLYQSGYLAIKSYDNDLEEYTLGFPNDEVEYGF
jgi:hypothetical protein